ncbi:MAG TPA: peptidylprolyl isomerase [Caldimonas sp.]|nr:peptidylprolyl isomerase [Caldimonas sp.]HEX2541015.1 peptidylprolyl isomerase [Caldimonas sp.]
MTKQVDLETSQGTIRLELDEAKAPETVKNFLTNVENGHYDGTVFHRVIKGFMVQGGGFEPGMVQKPTGPTIQNEASNGLRNDRYTVAMARTSAPHSATAQFFINVADNEFLNFKSETAQGWGYAVFGRVVSGQEIVDAIEQVRTGSRGGHADVPLDDVTITRATVVS